MASAWPDLPSIDCGVSLVVACGPMDVDALAEWMMKDAIALATHDGEDS